MFREHLVVACATALTFNIASADTLPPGGSAPPFSGGEEIVLIPCDTVTMLALCLFATEASADEPFGPNGLVIKAATDVGDNARALGDDVRAVVGGNLEAAQGEAGTANQAVRAVTGVSVGDIERHGLAGGANSEVNRAGDAIADVFGW